MASTAARLITILAASLPLSCGTLVCVGGPCDAVRIDFETRMIVPNEHSVTRTGTQILADIDECDAYSASERQRLLAELWAFDPYLEKYARATRGGRSVGGTR